MYMSKTVRSILIIFVVFTMLFSFAACNNPEGEKNSSEATTEKSGSVTENTNATEKNETESTVTSDESSATETETETEEQTSLILGDDVEYAADFTVSKVFGDNMIIQRNEFIRVWGWAEESENGKKVSASYKGEVADAIIENGEWEIVICCKLEASTESGHDLKVYTSDKEIAFKDVLVGDVYMVIGQSNVQYDINSYLSSEPNKKWTLDQIENNPYIRINYNSNTDTVGYPVRGTTDVCKDVVTNNGWAIPNKSNIMRLSAIGYFIAHQVSESTENKIPVGIVQFSANGRTLSVFMPNSLADELKTDQFDEAQGVYIGKVHTHVITRYMYNHYMNPYEKMPIAGVVWYQGEAESSAGVSTVFVEKFTALMNYMRSTHNLVNPEFPVFVVEFPTIYSKPADYTGEWSYLDTGRIRAVEGTIPMSLSNSYIAVGSDIWTDEKNANNVHPYSKYEQAERVSALLNAVIYGNISVDEASGPILESWEFSADRKTITLKFKNVGEGLKTSDGGTTVTGIFQLNKKNNIEKRYPVVAEITAPDTITVTCEREMCGVAYHALPEYFYGNQINLCDSDGTPAAAFWVFNRGN